MTTKTISEKEAYDNMFRLLLADEFMEFKLPKMGLGALDDNKESWVKHICEQEGISVLDWNLIVTIYLFMGYTSERFIKAYRSGEKTDIPPEIRKAAILHLAKKKWEQSRN